jgi:hypothetical protein
MRRFLGYVNYFRDYVSSLAHFMIGTDANGYALGAKLCSTTVYCFPVYILVRTDLGTGSKCSYTVADGSFEFIRQPLIQGNHRSLNWHHTARKYAGGRYTSSIDLVVAAHAD